MNLSEGLLPGTRRALSHRLAVGQAHGRTPSLVDEGAVGPDDALERRLPDTGV